MFGIARITWSWPSVPIEAPSSSPRRGPTGRPGRAAARPDLAADPGQHLGLDPEQDDVGAVDRLDGCRRRPGCRTRRGGGRAAPARGWLATIWSGATSSPRRRPAIIASAMTPEPTVAIVRPLERRVHPAEYRTRLPGRASRAGRARRSGAIGRGRSLSATPWRDRSRQARGRGREDEEAAGRRDLDVVEARRREGRRDLVGACGGPSRS